jgi:hypothetical protein
MSCLLRLSTPLKSNFKALFSSRNTLRALTDAIVLLAGCCHVGRKTVKSSVRNTVLMIVHDESHYLVIEIYMVVELQE